MTTRILFAIALAAALTAPADSFTRQANDHAPKGGMFEIPAVMKAEHEKLHEDLSAAVKAGGTTGQAAGRVAAVLHPHFQSEEAFALPPLGLLRALAEGHATPDMRDVVVLTDRLKQEMPRMLNEHRSLVSALEDLGKAAAAERHPEVVGFVQELTVHAQTEEHIHYPAAILVGEYLKLKFPR